ncbi:hypothetical protein D9E39_17810 [Escherichia coli]|nr:hypothetical protein [Escherichia coli]
MLGIFLRSMTNQHLIFYLSMMMVYVGIRTIFLVQSKKPSIKQRNAMPKQPTMNAGITANIIAGF